MSPKESKRISSAYKNEHNRLLGYIRKRIPSYVEAEDILQDIFYQLTVGFNDSMLALEFLVWHSLCFVYLVSRRSGTG